MIGAKLANELADDMLPAILHAIDSDEHEVRICAQKASRPRVDDPARLLLWLLRERKHAGPVQEREREPYGGPPPSTPEQLQENLERMRDWKRIQQAIDRRQDIKDIYEDICRMEPDPKRVRVTMIDLLDEMNRQRQEAQHAT